MSAPPKLVIEGCRIFVGPGGGIDFKGATVTLKNVTIEYEGGQAVIQGNHLIGPASNQDTNQEEP